MTKKIFLAYGNRNKKISFTPQHGESDLNALRRAVSKAAETDVNLLLKLHDELVLIKQRYVKANGQVTYVDIDSEDEIENENDLILLNEGDPAPEIPRNIPNPNSGPPNTPSENSDRQSAEESQASRNGEVTLETEAPLPPEPHVEVRQEVAVAVSQQGTSSGLITRKKKHTQGSRAPPSIQLPDLPHSLKQFIGIPNAVTINHSAFYSFYGDWLLSTPNPQDLYKPAAEAISEKFPELRDADKGCTMIRVSLSQYVRNTRRRRKGAVAKAQQLLDGTNEDAQSSSDGQSQKNPPKKLKKSKKSVVTPPFKEQDDDTTEAQLKEDKKSEDMLQELGAHQPNSHILRLMRQTFTSRVKWIEGLPTDVRASDILAKYPHLKYVDVIIQETTLRINKAESELRDAMGCFLDNLVLCENRLGNHSPKMMSLFIEEFYAQQKPKNTPKGIPDSFVVLEAFSNLSDDLCSRKNEGPRAILYISDDSDEVIDAFIVADEEIRIQISEPNVVTCLLALICCYHAWDLTFPHGSKTFLSIFDHYVLGSTVRDQTIAFKAFQKCYQNWKNSQSTDD